MIATARLIHSAVIIALAFAARALHSTWRAPDEVGSSILWHLALGLLFAAAAAVLASPPITRHVTTAILSAAGAAIAGLSAAATMLVIAPNTVPRFSVLATTVLVFCYLALVGAVLAVRRRRVDTPLRVLTVAAARDAATLAAEPPPARGRVFDVVDEITDEAEHDRIALTADELDVDVVVVGRRAALNPTALEQVAELHERGIRIRSLESFYDEQLGKLPLSSLDRFAMMGDVQSLHGGYAPVKRALDLALGVVGGLVLVAILPFVLVGNLVANRGPLFFRQPRIGLQGEPFEILKLRTMHPGAQDISGWTKNNDPRITTFGQFLRRTHIDELPQVLNIVRGDLSVIGPRPEQPRYVEQLSEKLPYYAARHLVRPGLTGWAQVMYPYAASEEDAFVKLQYDLHYLRHESLTTDLRIIGLTVSHLLRGGGR